MITVLGAGAFGTAIANLLAENGHAVTLWCYEADVARSIKLMGLNERYLPGVALNDRITPTTSLEIAVQNQLIFEAIPVAHLRSVLEQAQPYAHKQLQWVALSKGIESTTHLLPTEIISHYFPTHHVAVLSGPSFAKGIAAQQPTHVTIAAHESTLAHQIKNIVTNRWFTAEVSADVRGVQLCGAYKNVAAIAVGMLAGAQYGENTKAAFLVRALAEMEQLVHAAGGKRETVYGPAGLGDLMLTCYGAQSRNRTLGEQLGAGEKLETILTQLGTTPEGLNTVVALHQYAQKNNLTLAITSMVHEIIFNHKSVIDLVRINA